MASASTLLTVDSKPLQVGGQGLYVEPVFGALAGVPSVAFHIEGPLETAFPIDFVSGSPGLEVDVNVISFSGTDYILWDKPGGRWQIPAGWRELVLSEVLENPSGLLYGRLLSDTDFFMSGSLITYLPEAFRSDPHLRDYFNAVGSEFDRFRAALDMVLCAWFVAEAPEWALEFWGDEVGDVRGGLPVEEYRSLIQSELTEVAITRQEVIDKIVELGSLDEAPVLKFPADYTAHFTIGGVLTSEVQRREVITDGIRRRMPAHIALQPVLWLADLPTVPLSVAAVNVDGPPGGVLVSWSAPSQTGGSGSNMRYHIRYKLSSASAWTDGPQNVSGLSEEVIPLTHGASYDISVRAQNVFGEGPWSDSVSIVVDYAEPSVPRNFVLGRLSGGRIRASWYAPQYDGGRTLGDYEVRWKKSTSSVWGSVRSVSSTMTDIEASGLSTGSWDVSARATNVEGESAWVVGSVTPYTVPSVPRSVGVSAVSLRSVDVSWMAPADNGTGSAVNGYDLRYKLSSASSWTGVSVGVQLSRTISGLSPGSAYDFQVRAHNEVGNGSWTSSKSVTLSTGTPDALAPPTLTASGVSFTASWGFSPDDKGEPVTSYGVRYRTGSGSWTVRSTSSRSVTVSGLRKNTEYEVQVRASNANGASPWSGSSEVTIPATVPSVPRNVEATPAAEDAEATVSWDAPSDSGGVSVTGYRVRYKLSSSSSWSTVSVSGRSAKLSGLTRGSTYDVGVLAVNSVGSSSWSSTVSMTVATGLPGVPRSLKVTVSGTSISASWSAPVSDGGSDITSYGVRYRTGSGSWTVRSTSTAGSVTFSGFSKNTTYEFQVRSVNDNGESAWTDSVEGVTAATVPSAPRSLSLSSSGTTVSASWLAPADDGGLSISGYLVVYSFGSSSFSISTSSLSASLKNIPLGSSVAVTVRAINSEGNSAWASKSYTLPTGLPTAPNAPVLSGVQATQISVSWSGGSDSGSAITGYTVRYRVGTGSWVERKVTSMSYSQASLAKKTTYEFQVKATNANGDSPWSGSSSATTLATVPSVPTSVLMSAAAITSFSIRWKAPSDDGGSAVTGFDLRFREVGKTSWTERDLGLPTPTSSGVYLGKVTGRQPGGMYEFSIRAYNGEGDGPWSSVIQVTLFTGVPDAPTALKLVKGSDLTSIVCSWTKPNNDGGSAITGYKVRHRIGTGAWTTLTSSGTGTSYTISGLTADNTYEVQVASTNTNGDSAFTAGVSLELPVTLPSAPTDVEAFRYSVSGVIGGPATDRRFSSREARVRFGVPDDNGGSEILEYEVNWWRKHTGRYGTSDPKVNRKGPLTYTRPPSSYGYVGWEEDYEYTTRSVWEGENVTWERDNIYRGEYRATVRARNKFGWGPSVSHSFTY